MWPSLETESSQVWAMQTRSHPSSPEGQLLRGGTQGEHACGDAPGEAQGPVGTGRHGCFPATGRGKLGFQGLGGAKGCSPEASGAVWSCQLLDLGLLGSGTSWFCCLCCPIWGTWKTDTPSFGHGKTLPWRSRFPRTSTDGAPATWRCDSCIHTICMPGPRSKQNRLNSLCSRASCCRG